jgi:hypothetical protein
VNVERLNSALAFRFRINLRPARKTRPAAFFADHPRNHRPQIVLGDSERELGFSAEARSFEETSPGGNGGHVLEVLVGDLP